MNILQRPDMNSAETDSWRSLIHERCGLYFTDGRLYFMQQRIWERMRHCKMTNYSTYYHYVLGQETGAEWLRLRDQLLNNETSFFRHRPSFRALGEHVLPNLMAQKRKEGGRLLTGWSAGCSTGQEPYSLIMVMLELLPSHLWQVHVQGTDISKSALDRARQGHYKPYQVRTMPDYFQKKYMRPADDGFQICPKVQACVQLGGLNLYDSTQYLPTLQDIIFCQNVLIYFQVADRIAIAQRLAASLKPGGYLFFGPAELMGLKLDGLRLLRLPDSLIYQKI